MHSLDVPEFAATPHDPTDASRPLNDLEQALLDVLTAELVSTTVVRDRARLKSRESSPELSRKRLSAAHPIATIASQLEELGRRGLAEKVQVDRCVRWRRASVAEKPAPASRAGF